MSINDAESMYSSTGGFWPPVNRVFRKLGYEIVPTKARLPKEVRQDYDRVMTVMGSYTFKFLDVRTFLTATLLNAYRLGLHNSAPLSILDLGTGVGYFPVVCAHYGHSVIAIDRDGNRIFEEFPIWLGVDRRTHEIRAGEPLPVMETRFDLVLSDIGLPDEDGFTLMRKLRDAYGLRGIALTGYGMEEDQVRSNEAGFISHLTKPISVQILDRALAEVFRKN